MITLSNFVVLGIIEVYALFIGGLIVLSFYNRSLSLRISKLRDLVHNLKQRLNQKKTKPQSSEPSYLESALTETESRFKLIEPNSTISLSEKLEIAPLLIALRFEFLKAEIEVSNIEDEEEKWKTLAILLSTMIDQLQLSSEKDKSPDTPINASVDKLTESWQDLCMAAVKMRESRSSEIEDNLMALFQVINSELGYDQLDIPERKPLSEHGHHATSKNVGAVNDLKESAGENKKLIATLLSQKDAAETEVSIKMEELTKLQQFFNESEVCIKLLEDELDGLREELNAQQESPSDYKDLQELVQSFAKESSEMLTCIDTLEQENTALRKKLNPES